MVDRAGIVPSADCLAGPPGPGQPPPFEAWAVLLFALAPMLVSMLGTFLWATPAVSMELEHAQLELPGHTPERQHGRDTRQVFHRRHLGTPWPR